MWGIADMIHRDRIGDGRWLGALLVILLIFLICQARPAVPEPTQTPKLILARGHPQGITKVVPQPGGQLLGLTMEWYGRTSVVDLLSDREIVTLPDTGYCELALSPDGKRLATCCPNGNLRVWDLKTGTQKRLAGHDQGIDVLEFSPDGKVLASSGGDKKVCLWDAATGALLRTHYFGQYSSYNLRFSPDGNRLALAPRGVVNGKFYFWDIRSGALGPGHPSPGRHLAFSPKGEWLAIGEEGLAVWSVREDRLKVNLPGEHIYGLAFSPDGDLLTLGPTGLARRDPHTGKVRSEETLAEKHLGNAREATVDLDPYGRFLVHTVSKGCIKIEEIASGKVVARSRPRIATPGKPALSPDGRFLAMGEGGRILLWDLISGQPLTSFGQIASTLPAFTPHGTLLSTPLAFSLQCTLLACEGKSGVELWTVNGPRRVRFLPGNRGGGPYDSDLESPLQLVFSPDGKLLARVTWVCSGLVDPYYMLHLLDTQSLKSVVWIEASSAAFSPDGRLLATVDDSKKLTVSLREVGSGKAIRTLAGDVAEAAPLAFRPDGRVLAGGAGAWILLWDMKSGKVQSKLTGHRNRVGCLAFRSDGTLASGSDDNTARLWDTKGRHLRTFAGHPAGVDWVGFRGDKLMTASIDGVRLWETASGKLLARAVVLDGGQNWVVISPDGRFDGSKEGISLLEWKRGERYQPVGEKGFTPSLLALLLGER